jgi:group I intron endonuclease
MIGIYRIINPKGKIYIGQTTNFEQRKNYYKRNSATKTQIKLFNSIKKYGFDAHLIEFIEECDINQLNDRERYWQDFYNVIGENGLNLRLTKSNDKSGYLSEETKNKLSLFKKNNPEKHKHILNYCDNWKGRKHTEETKYNMRLSALGKKKTAEHISKLPQNQKGYKRKNKLTDDVKNKMVLASPLKKRILQYDRNGNFIAEYTGINIAAKSLGIKKGSNISSCANGKLVSAYGYIWKYK